MVRGRRTRAVQPSIKQPTKMTKTRATNKNSNAISKTPMNKSTTNDCDTNFTISMKTITERTRNLRRSLHKIQKQFDNQAITKFFQRKLNTNIINTEIDVDNDENACDAFTTDNDDKNDVEMVKVQAFSSFNFQHDNIINRQRFDGDNIDVNQNSNGSEQSNNSHNTIQSTNIFLQKPILHLNIDTSTLKQVSSIVINKNSEKCPNFANSFKGFNGCNINTANHQKNDSPMENDQLLLLLPANADSPSSHQSIDRSEKKCENPKQRKLRPRKCANRIYSDSGYSDAINNSNSNSYDSGVVSDRSFELNSDANKPTTPHRIVCPTSTIPTAGVTAPHNIQAKLFKPNVSNKMIAVRRNKASSARNGVRLNSSKSYFTKLVKSDVKSDNIDKADATVNTKEEVTKTDENDDKMSRLCDSVQPIIGITNEIVKNQLKCQPLSRSSTPSQLKPIQSKQMTDFFPVRRSIRKTKRAVEQEYLRHIEKAIEHQQEDGLVVRCFKDKGRGICAGRPFARGEFVVEYIGDLIEQNEADRREEIYAKDTAFGCYMYYFKHKEQQWCIDATSESGKLGRLVNHSRNGNLITKIVIYKNRPHLVLVAKHMIKEGEELTYDYGDRTRESLINHPWLAL